MNSFLKWSVNLVLYLVLLSQVSVSFAQNQTKKAFRKGSLHTGFALNIVSSHDDNIENVLLEIVDKTKRSYNFNLYGGYFYKDKQSLGFRYGYEKSETNLSYVKDNEIALVQSAANLHNIEVFQRVYLPLNEKQVFSFFNETDLGFGFGNSIRRNTKSKDDVTKQFTEDFSVRLGLKPGMTVILTKGFAFEASVNLLGLSYARKKIERDDTAVGHQNDFKFNFDISLFTLGFGLGYYF